MGESIAPSGEGWYFTASGGVGPSIDGPPPPSSGGVEWDISKLTGWVGPHTDEHSAQCAGERRVDFKRLILGRCEEEFKRASASHDALVKAEASDEILVAEGVMGMVEAEAAKAVRAGEGGRTKQRVLSAISFIGQLYLLEGLVSTRILRFCFFTLLNGGKTELIEEADMGGLCWLLQLCGKKLEAEECELVTSGLEEKDKEAMLPVYVSILGCLASDFSNPRLSPRIRLVAQEIVELAQNGWKMPEGGGEGEDW